MSKRREQLDVKLLYVEDDIAIREITKIHLSRYVRELVVASNGVEGLLLYRDERPDIVLTDIEMPEMNGLEMSKRIRESDEDIPIVIMTAFSDSHYFMKSIDLGITGFLLKPSEIKKMQQVLKKAYAILQSQKLQKEVEEKNRELSEKNDILEDAYEQLRIAKEGELELHIYKDRYHTLQQQMAFKKQQKIIIDELSYINERGLFCSSYYKPLDILSGDSYGTIRIDEDHYFYYIVDAMGKGLSASVTSIQSISYINNYINKRRKRLFALEDLVNSFLEFIKNQLLDEEMLSVIFVYHDRKDREVRYVNFSMPPILIETFEGEIVEFEGLNPPITKSRKAFKVGRFSCGNFKKMLIYSDGLADIKCHAGELYQNHLLSDFQESVTQSKFIELMRSKVKKIDDDITLIYISKIDFEQSENKMLVVRSSMDEYCEAAASILTLFDEFLRDVVERSQFQTALMEIGFNAIEHGNFGITYDEKRVLLFSGRYDDVLAEKLEAMIEKSVKIYYHHFIINGDCVIIVSIVDEGNGFNVASTLKLVKSADISTFNGRGIKIAENVTDGVFYNPKGNEATVIKVIKAER